MKGANFYAAVDEDLLLPRSLFRPRLTSRAGDVEVLHLPSAGLYANSHFLSNLNSIKVADLLSQFLRQKELYEGGRSGSDLKRSARGSEDDD